MDEAYVTVTCIGKGSSGSVYLARSNKIKKLVAIKKIQIDETRRSRCRKSVIREANILRTLNHFHIVKCYEWFLEEQGADISMVLEYCNGGTLQDRIASTKKSNSRLEENKVLEWTTQIASAVDYIHERRILHRDLKSENVFLLKSEVVKLGDFGISKEIDHTLDKASTCVGTPCYLSPELCQDIPYNFKSDIWALGCLVFEMCALKPAFDAANLISLFYKIVNGKYSPLPETCSSSLKEFVANILVRDPDQRPTARQLLNLPVLQKFVSKIRVRSPEPGFENDPKQHSKEPSKNLQETGYLDDLDELLSQTEQEIADKDLSNKSSAVPNNRSFSVHGNCAVTSDDLDDLVSENDLTTGRPQTCPHSAVLRDSTCTPTDTIATWSGYGDRGSKRPSAKNKQYSSSDDSDDLSDYNSDIDSSSEKVTIRRNYSSEDFSSYSEDEDFINTARTGLTVDEEIPEVIEACDDTKVLSLNPDKPSNAIPVSSRRNLPGSVWLQSKRAQVLRQKEKPPPPFVVSKKPQQTNVLRSSYPGTSGNHTHVKKETAKSDNTFTATNTKKQRKERLPGSSWLKKGSRSNTQEIVLGQPGTNEKKRKHNDLPGSAWLVDKDSPETYRSTSDDYPDDFEEYDDDFDQDGDDDLDTSNTPKPLSSMQLVKQDCIDSVGKEVFDHLKDLFAKGFSIGEAYEKCKDKVDFETVETCYLLSA